MSVVIYIHMKKAEIPQAVLYLAISLLEATLSDDMKPIEADDYVETVVKALKPYLEAE